MGVQFLPNFATSPDRSSTTSLKWLPWSFSHTNFSLSIKKPSRSSFSIRL